MEDILEFNKQFAKRLRFFLERDNMTQVELARKLKVSPQSVTNWITAVKTPRMDKVDAMCEIFNCRRSDFSEPIVARKASLPLYGSVSAGNGVFADDCIEEWIDIGNKNYSPDTHFMLRVKGDSMEPELHDGDIVIARKQDTAEDNELVIAIVNGDEGVCKRFKKYQGSVALLSENPAYPPRYFSEEEIHGIPVKIAGKVVELNRRF